MNNEFLTYNTTREYATLNAYGYPNFIVVDNGKIYDCSNYFYFSDDKPELIELLMNSVEYSREYLDAPVGGFKTYTKGKDSIHRDAIYNNYFLSPWGPLNKQKDLDYYRLCNSPMFHDIHPRYFGTNYGTVWSTSYGGYLSPYQNRSNRDGNAYQVYRLECDPKLNPSGFYRRTITAHRISAYFVLNPNPKNYNVVCHKDNNPSNNYYKNLYWGTQKQNIEQAASDNRTNRTVNKTVILDIIEESNRAIQEGKSRQDVYEKYANLFGITSRTIYNLIDLYGLKNNLIAYNYKTQQKSKTELPYNVCTLANDYDKNGDYVLLDSYGRRDIIITVDHRAFYISKKTIDMYFPKDDKSVWPSIFELQEQPYLKEVVTKHPEKLQFNDTSCQYVPSKIAKWSVLYDSYFGESPWYLRCVRGFDISYVQMSSHSEFSDVLDAYFLCSTGRIFTLSAGKYLNEYSKKNSDIKECFLGCKTNKKGMTRSIGVLLELFGFND